MSAHYAPRADDDSRYELVSSLVAPFRDDLLSACTGRLGVMADPAALEDLPEWRSFLTGHTVEFPCGSLSSVGMAQAPYGYEIQRHLHQSLSMMFRFVGPRLSGVAYYQSIQFGLFVALLFGVCRLAMGRVLAAMAMLPVILSPRHLEMALAPIEYAKAPFFAACLLGMGAVVVIRMSSRAAVAITLATGASVGIGIGFKPDVMVFAPFGLLALALFYRDAEGVSFRRHARVAAAFVVGVVVAGAPLLQTHFGGPQRSLLPVQILGGLSPGFTRTYAVPGLYDYGVMFDDAHVIAVINSYNQRVHGSQEFGIFFSEILQRAAFDLLATLARTFPADLVLRSYAAVLQVMQFAPFGVLVMAAALVLLLRRDPRLAGYASFAIAYMVGYVSLVLAPKHYFHLEFVPWLLLGLFLAELGRARHADRSWGRTLLTAAACGVALLGLLFGARRIQDPKVRSLIANYTQADRFRPLAADVASTADATTIVPDGVAVDTALPSAPLVSAASFTSPLVAADYLSLNIECARPGVASVAATYVRPQGWRDPLDIACERSGQRWQVLWPVYQHAPYYVFLGFEIVPPDTVRGVSVSRAKDVGQFPLLLRMRLPEDWAARSMHQQAALAALSPLTRRPVVSALGLPQPRTAGRWDPPGESGDEALSNLAEPLASWTPQDGVDVTPSSSGVVVVGNTLPAAYQLVSPPLAVPQNSILNVRVRGQILQGGVAFGILDASGMRWLLPASSAVSDFSVATGANKHVTFVFANNLAPGATTPSRFTVESVSYEFANSITDRLYHYLWPTP